MKTGPICGPVRFYSDLTRQPMNHDKTSETPARLRLQVRQIRFEGVGINSYELVDPAGLSLPSFEAGAHIDVHLAQGLVRQYSLSNDPAERHRYVIAVLNDANGRGGSQTLHAQLHVQDFVEVSSPRNNFHLSEQAEKVILIAGGIGVTPLKSMAHHLERTGKPYALYYCAKDRNYAAFTGEFELFSSKDSHRFHFDGGNPAEGLNISELLREPEDGQHVYYCGPAGFMKACAAAAMHWPTGTVHAEHFKAAAETIGETDLSVAGAVGGFTVKVASSGALVEVGPQQSIVDALSAIGVVIETSCQSGLCGSCKTHYLSGDVDHHDCILSDDEHKAYLTACVSRARSGVLVLDL